MSLPLKRLGSAAALTLATALGYGLAAWAALIFLTGTSGIAIFWPASGLSAGLAIAIGRSGYGPVALGTILASIVVNMYFGRDFWVATGFGLCNAGESLLLARLLELVPEQPLAYRRLMRALAFFAAASASAAAAGLGAGLLIEAAAYDGTSSLLDMWRTWSLSDLVGIVVVTPLVVAVHGIATKPELRRPHDWKPDVAVLFLFVAVAYQQLGVRLDEGTWSSITPGAALLPLLLWLSARSQPIVPALAVVMLAVMIALFAAAGSGRYGDPRVPLEARIVGAQVALGAATIVAQVVMAIYTDRKLAVVRLKASELRLAAIVDTAPGVIFSAEARPDGTVSFPFVSSTSLEMLGIPADQLAAEPSRLLGRLDPKDRDALLEALRDRDRKDTVVTLELPLEHRTSSESWIEIKARPIFDGDQHVIWHGFIQDVTMRRRMVEELVHRARNLLSVTQAIAENTARHTPPSEFADVLAERLAGLAASHQLLAAHRWEGAELKSLAGAQLSHLSDLFGRRLMIDGPEVLLEAQAAQVIGMTLHELATNACKHGALAATEGTVHLSWTLPEAYPDGAFRMCWQEQGGKPVPAVLNKGFGTKVTTDMPTYQLGAEVNLEPRSDGLVWCLAAPARNVVRSVPRNPCSRATSEASITGTSPGQVLGKKLA